VSEEGFWAKLNRLLWRRSSASRTKERLDLDIVDPFERFEISIRRASEGYEEKE
jgi:hypothetical protein